MADNKNQNQKQEERRAEDARKASEETQSRTNAEVVADEANKTGIKPGDLVASSDYRTVTTPEAAITAARGVFSTTSDDDGPKIHPDIPAVPESQEEKFNNTMEEVSKLLARTPHAMTVELKREGGVHRYSYADDSGEGQKAREQAREKLRDLYNNGAYNYSQFAERLRLTNKDVQSLLDEDWRDQQGIA